MKLHFSPRSSVEQVEEGTLSVISPSPLVLIVGFLGAGKTTFLRELLPLLEARGLDPFVVINDYANAKVDAASLIKEGRVVMPVNGNCICCDSVMELMEILLEIPPSDRRIVLVEANGTTDPTALVEHLLVNPELRQRFAPLIQVAIVDLKRWQKRHWHNELEHLQVETASHFVFTRTEEVPKKRSTDVLSDIVWFNPQAKRTQLHSFALELERLSAVGRPAPETDIPKEPAPELGQPHHHHQHEDAHDLHDHHAKHSLSHAFVGVQLDLPSRMTSRHLQRWIKALPAQVLRVKGVVRLADVPGRWFQFQRINELRGEATLYELPNKPVVPPCAVLIGVKLNLHTIRQLLDECSEEQARITKKSRNPVG